MSYISLSCTSSSSTLYADQQNCWKAVCLIAAVVRAFYTDDHAIVIDALMRDDGGIPQEALGPRLSMCPVVVKSVVAKLLDDQMICREVVNLPNKGGALCYLYVDYQYCVDVIRYRIYSIYKTLNNHLQTIADNTNKLRCPTCYQTYSIIEAMSLQYKDHQFACVNCLIHRNIYYGPIANLSRDVSAQSSDPRYCLQVFVTRDDISETRAEIDKIKQQFQPIDKLLLELKDKPLPRNLPSQQVAIGKTHNFSSYNKQQRSQIESNLKQSSSIRGTQYGSNVKQKHVDKLLQRTNEPQSESKNDIEIQLSYSEENGCAEGMPGVASLFTVDMPGLISLPQNSQDASYEPSVFSKHGGFGEVDDINGFGESKIDNCQVKGDEAELLDDIDFDNVVWEA